MIVPSIDVRKGQAVQLRGGEELVIEAGDPVPLARRFGRLGEVAVVDLDAACGEGSNEDVLRRLCRIAPCRVGGGIRDAATARAWLDAGARHVVLGTAAVPELLRELPRERVVAALDARDGEVVVEGWRRRTGRTVEERMLELRPLVGGFLVTSVEREGRLAGVDLDLVARLVGLAAPARLTIAGGVATAKEIAAIDRLGAHAQVGMALYTGWIGLADALAATLESDRPDGLWPTVVCDPLGRALGLAWSNRESLERALETGEGWYWSRSRGLWRKGGTSGATQELLRVDTDCDRDALRFVVRQRGPGFCHEPGRFGCFDAPWPEGGGLGGLLRRIDARIAEERPGSYTGRLLREPELLAAKLREEADELAGAEEDDDVAHELADLVYFALVAARRKGVGLEELEAELDRRSLRLTRSGGDAKEGP